MIHLFFGNIFFGFKLSNNFGKFEGRGEIQGGSSSRL